MAAVCSLRIVCAVRAPKVNAAEEGEKRLRAGSTYKNIGQAVDAGLVQVSFSFCSSPFSFRRFFSEGGGDVEVCARALSARVPSRPRSPPRRASNVARARSFADLRREYIYKFLLFSPLPWWRLPIQI